MYQQFFLIKIPNGVDATPGVSTPAIVVLGQGTAVRGKDRFCGRFLDVINGNAVLTGKSICSKYL